VLFHEELHHEETSVVETHSKEETDHTAVNANTGPVNDPFSWVGEESHDASSMFITEIDPDDHSLQEPESEYSWTPAEPIAKPKLLKSKKNLSIASRTSCQAVSFSQHVNDLMSAWHRMILLVFL